MYKTWFHRQRDIQKGLPPESSNKASADLIAGSKFVHGSGGTTVRNVDPLEPDATKNIDNTENGEKGEDTDAAELAVLQKQLELETDEVKKEDIQKQITALQEKIAAKLENK